MTAEDEIRALLATYEKALNASDTSLAVSVYAHDGTFMPTTLPTATGPELEGAYRETFEKIRLEVTFTVDEVVVANEEVAYALTRSNGTQTVLGSGAVSTESNREVFIFRRENGEWKIARYLFNKPQ